MYVASRDSNYVTVIDGDTNATINIDIGTTAGYIAVNPSTNEIYVTSYAYAPNGTVLSLLES